MEASWCIREIKRKIVLGRDFQTIVWFAHINSTYNGPSDQRAFIWQIMKKRRYRGDKRGIQGARGGRIDHANRTCNHLIQQPNRRKGGLCQPMDKNGAAA